MSRLGIILALTCFTGIAHAQVQAGLQAQQAAQAQQQRAAADAEQEQQAQLPLRASLDPTRILTVGLWPGPDVPCKLPKRDRPYVCHRLLAGPAVVLSRVYGELIVARGDAALAKGARSWWVRSTLPTPLGIAAGEVLYRVGDEGAPGEGDDVATVYR